MLTPILQDGPGVDQNLAVSVAVVALSFGTTHLLGRMWAGPEYVASNVATLGRRLAHAFEVLFAITILTGFVHLPGLVLLRAVLTVALLASFFGALVLAVPRPEASPPIG
jgi:hypothetical protein